MECGPLTQAALHAYVSIHYGVCIITSLIPPAFAIRIAWEQSYCVVDCGPPVAQQRGSQESYSTSHIMG